MSLTEHLHKKLRWIEGYCPGVDCPAREIQIYLKDNFEEPLPLELHCCLCGGVLKIHKALTGQEHSSLHMSKAVDTVAARIVSLRSDLGNVGEMMTESIKLRRELKLPEDDQSEAH